MNQQLYTTIVGAEREKFLILEPLDCRKRTFQEYL